MGHLVKGRGRVVPGVVMDARAEALRIVSEARREADAVLAAAERERERLRRQALDEARAQASVELCDVLAAGRSRADELLARAAPDALAVAARMAELIVGRAVALDPTVMADIAGEALAASRTRAGGITLRVHPQDLAAVEAHRAALAARLGGEAALEIVADEAAGRHGCVVDTAVGRVDARLPVLLSALTASLDARAGSDG
jgi:flagellar biosynthesis/type III secretory pathway protein FliH